MVHFFAFFFVCVLVFVNKKVLFWYTINGLIAFTYDLCEGVKYDFIKGNLHICTSEGVGRVQFPHPIYPFESGESVVFLCLTMRKFTNVVKNPIFEDN